jgi:hypothetical protein
MHNTAHWLHATAAQEVDLRRLSTRLGRNNAAGGTVSGQ